MACHTPDIYQFETITEQKKFLRKRAKSFLKEYCADQALMEQASLSALDAMVKSSIYQKAPYILSFMPLKDELDLIPLMKLALKDGKKLLLPRMYSPEMGPAKDEELNPNSNDMDFFFVDDLEVAFDSDNPFSIREPSLSAKKLLLSELPPSSLMFVPGLAFNLEGDRLGRGKGFYDRFISRLAQSLPEEKMPLLCGVCFTICVTKGIPVEEKDRKVDWLLTEYGLVQMV